MRIEYGRQETEAEVRTRYLKEMMRVRNVTMKQLSMMTRINIRTLERYTSGRTDTADAAGLSVALISYVLSMNAYALGGAETLKPGMVFSNNGRQVVVKKYDFALHTKHAATDAFNWSMNRKRLDAEILAKKAGVPEACDIGRNKRTHESSRDESPITLPIVQHYGIPPLLPVRAKRNE